MADMASRPPSGTPPVAGQADPMGLGTPGEGPGDGKAELRREANRRRAAAHAALGVEGGRMIAEHFLAKITLPPRATVAGYAAIRDEPDVLGLLSKLHALGHGCVLPAVIGRSRALEFRRWHPGDPLESAEFGVPTPAAARGVVVPHVILVPLVAFDRRGQRIGYGGGFYDRTLETLRERGSLLTIGIAYADQEVPAVPAEAHDQPLDWVVTEREALQFS